MDQFEYDLLDLEVCKNIKLLHKMQIFIWGAAPKGRQIQKTLEREGISIVAFCDSDANKWGKTYKEIPVISPYKLEKLYKESPKVCIISCIFREHELLRVMQELELNQISFLSYWGIKTACVLNSIALESEGDLPTYDEVWMYQKCCALSCFGYPIHFLKNTKIDNTRIWNLQPGKTASKTIEARLKKAGVSSIHMHELTYPMMWTDALKTMFDSRIQSSLSQGIKIITGVREPISRDYSAFWQPFSGERFYVSAILNKDFQVMYEHYLKLLLEDNDCRKIHLRESRSDIWQDEFKWFNKEIKKHLGIDVYCYPFNRETGYQIIREGNIQIFIYQAEKLDNIMPVLSEFIGTDISSQEDDNLAENKPYYLAYKEFRNKVKLPRSYVEHYYKDNPYMNHFYTKDEQNIFLSRWKDCIDE